MILDQAFSLAQVLDLIGLLQCLFVLLLVGMKASDMRQAVPTVAFFAVLGLGFALPATTSSQVGYADIIATWVAQTWLPAVAYLLILQVATGQLPGPRHYLVLLLPLVGPVAILAAVAGGESCRAGLLCPEMVPALQSFGVVPGAAILLLIWVNRSALARLREQAAARDRYWVVLALIAFSVLNLGIDLPRALELLGAAQASLARTVFGLTFAYLATTLVFRIDPKPVVLMPGIPVRKPVTLSEEERALAERIKDLMTLDKIYQEPKYSRADLAHELQVSENQVSRIVMATFGKSFPQLLNSYRVAEAQQLLRDSDLSITQIAFDVGFNSLASFNRVFKDLVGQSPSALRSALSSAASEAQGASTKAPAAERQGPEASERA